MRRDALAVNTIRDGKRDNNYYYYYRVIVLLRHVNIILFVMNGVPTDCIGSGGGG